jgi:hypothetical protein
MNARKDQNFVNTLTAVLNTDGRTIELLLANPANHALSVNDGTTGSDLGPENAPHDENGVHTLVATSSADGVTPVVCYVDSQGRLLINSH